MTSSACIQASSLWLLEKKVDNRTGGENFEEIVDRSAALKRVLGEVETVAPTEASVLILGETGTGKESIARAIHRISPRTTLNAMMRKLEISRRDL